MESHDEFLELCAVSTSGELSDEEQRKLDAHLAGCAECRQALQEFEAAVDVGVPFLASKLSPALSLNSSEPFKSHSAKSERPNSVDGAASLRGDSNDAVVVPGVVERGFAFAQRNGHRRTQIHWNYVWLPFAACILLTVALGIYSYRMGRSRNVEVTQKTAPAPDTRIEALEQQVSDAGHEGAQLRLQLAQRDKTISDLRHQLQLQSASLDEMKNAQANLEKSIQNDAGEKQQSAQDRSTILQKLDSAAASLQKTQVSSIHSNGSVPRTSLARIVSKHRSTIFTRQLRDREQALDKEEDLLAHDRDVRELMGARDLHIADIYNVSRDGVTQKPYGRVFYTKGKSLVFYAYDLDQQAGLKNARTFQAWGRRGPDRSQALNLGIFYEDNAAKKRWVVKFDDAKTLEQIDAVFVTVEPAGGSHKPSGSPLLFTYLKIEANHP